MPEAFLLTRLLLRFEQKSEDVLSDISAAAFTPDGSLWVGSDELIGVERLSSVGAHVYGKHQKFALNDFVELFNTEDEIDIEGMDYANHYLWLTGSHSMKRKKPKGKKQEEDIERLTRVTTDSNRFLLARIPVIDDELVKSCSLSDKPDEKLRAACLQKSGDNRNLLIDAIKDDPHLEPFISSSIPSKDNGLDIEGLAVYNDKVFLGLRGPVLRGWAIILELEVTETEPGVLGLKVITEDGRLYKKHFVDLNGLGIRELCLRGEDLIILAGPTMDLEGSMRVFRLKEALNRSNSLCGQDSDDLEVLFDLPITLGTDHAEGLALYPCLGREGLMVVYDSPDHKRMPAPGEIFADVFRLP